MQNIKAIISNHGMSILHQNNEIKYECNCRKKKYCPLDRKCLSPNIVYQGQTTLSRRNCNEKVYFGIAQKLLKDSIATPNCIPMKTMQMTKNCRKNIGKLKGITIPKVLGAP